LDRKSVVAVDIFNANGIKVKTLISSNLQKIGYHRFTWDRTDSDGALVEKGIYLVILSSNSTKKVLKLIVN
jgi:flagellar hook assembly protein FlgD